MKMRRVIHIFMVAAIISFLLFWLTRYSVFDEQVSLRYEDWARGAILMDEEYLPPAARFWLRLALLFTAIFLGLALYKYVKNFDKK
jgi:hypothetical protein